MLVRKPQERISIENLLDFEWIMEESEDEDDEGVGIQVPLVTTLPSPFSRA